MKTILAVLMIPAALFATWATSFVQSAVREGKADSSPGTQGERVSAALDRKIENFRGSFLMDTTESKSVGAALRKGQATIDRAMGRETRDQQDYAEERARLAREIERERAEIRAIRAADAAVEAAKLRATLEAAEESRDGAVDPEFLDETRRNSADAIEKAKREVEAVPMPRPGDGE